MGWALMRRTNYALAGTRAYFEAPESIPARSAFPRLTWVDMALVALFMVGMYTNFTVQVSAKVPFPSAPAGVAGLILLWRRRDQITPHALACLIGVLALYLASIFCAPNPNLLQRRTTGLIQLTYSLIIGYALFLTVTRTSRRQFAGLFLSFAMSCTVRASTKTTCAIRCFTVAPGPSSSPPNPRA
jgi:CDP-diglyceride synthetase